MPLPLPAPLRLRDHATAGRCRGRAGTLGLSLPKLLAGEATTRATGKPKSVLMIVPWGGPAQVDTLDLKPDAPEEVRGEFNPIATRVPGTRICEHLPRLAAMADRYAIVRSLTHPITAHNPAMYYTLTGHKPADMRELAQAQRTDWPSLGSVLARECPTEAGVPGYVMEPCPLIEKGVAAGGQHAGFLGTRFDPFVVSADPSGDEFRVPDFDLAPGLSADRLADRRGLLEQLETRRAAAAPARDGYRDQAYDLLRARARSRAFGVAPRAGPRARPLRPPRFGQSACRGGSSRRVRGWCW